MPMQNGHVEELLSHHHHHIAVLETVTRNLGHYGHIIYHCRIVRYRGIKIGAHYMTRWACFAHQLVYYTQASTSTALGSRPLALDVCIIVPFKAMHYYNYTQYSQIKAQKHTQYLSYCTNEHSNKTAVKPDRVRRPEQRVCPATAVSGPRGSPGVSWSELSTPGWWLATLDCVQVRGRTPFLSFSTNTHTSMYTQKTISFTYIS